MTTLNITSVKIEMVKKTYSSGLTGFSNAIECVKYVTFDNGNKVTLACLLSYIGNENLDNWTGVEKVRKSNSEKNITTYLNKYINQFVNGLQLS